MTCEWRPTRTLADLIKRLINIIDNPQPFIPTPLKGRCHRCGAYKQPCVAPICMCGMFCCAKSLPEDLSGLADRRVVCCDCKTALVSSIPRGHQCTLEQIKASNSYIVTLYGYSGACVVNEDAALEHRRDKDKFMENVKNYALPRT